MEAWLLLRIGEAGAEGLDELSRGLRAKPLGLEAGRVALAPGGATPLAGWVRGSVGPDRARDGGSALLAARRRSGRAGRGDAAVKIKLAGRSDGRLDRVVGGFARAVAGGSRR